MAQSAPTDPFTILGTAQDAGETEIRARYLELVKRFPPDREPDKFREIRAAFEAVQDPLAIARRLLQPPDREAPRWEDAIEAQKQVPPPLAVSLLLSLGNRDAEYQAADAVQRGDAARHPDETTTQRGPDDASQRDAIA